MIMNEYTFKEKLTAFGAGKVLDMIKSDPEKNLPKMMNWVDRFDVNNQIVKQRAEVRKVLENPENPWNQYIMSLWTDIDDDVRARFFMNFVVNSALIGQQRSEKVKETHSCNAPYAILLDPTSACNLKCTGCWAAEYGNRLNMSYEELDGIIIQGKALGVYFYLYSGGEPLMRKDDIIRLCEAHPDCTFSCFTNGTLIDEAFADEILRVKNFIPGISIEGNEAETDGRRGKGTCQKVLHAMRILKERRLVFGASCCYTSANAYTIGSEAYFDFLIDQGCKFAWFFTYMPVGAGAPTDLLATPEQREYMFHQVRRFRREKPLFTVDFWNDGEFVGGCIAGGRAYMHINANGDIEPCAFIHYSDSNIREHTLLDALKRPLFMQYHDNQPFSGNMLRPCPLLDNEGKLAELVRKSGAHSTDLASPEDVDSLCAKCGGTCRKWQPAADKLWAQNPKCKPGDLAAG